MRLSDRGHSISFRCGARRMWRAVLLAVLVPLLSAQSVPDPTQGEACTKDLMFVFDASGSMGTTDLTAKIPHIQRVKNAFRRIVREIPASRRMGLIVYGQGAYNRCDSIELKLRPRINAGAAMLAEIQKVTPAGRTPLTQAVHDAADVLDYRRNPSVVVLLTDGEETCGGKPCEVAQALKLTAADLTIHVIGYRHSEAGGLSAIFGARCLAEMTGGLYLPVETEDEIVDALRRTLVCPMTTHNQSLPSPSFTRAAISIPTP